MVSASPGTKLLGGVLGRYVERVEGAIMRVGRLHCVNALNCKHRLNIGCSTNSVTRWVRGVGGYGLGKPSVNPPERLADKLAMNVQQMFPGFNQKT